jgi:hypothetical protein
LTLTSIEAILSALNNSGARYLIVGGLAVAAHGYGRLTIDLDLVVQLTPTNARNVVEALSTLGYKPIVPVIALDFADPSKRREWIEQKGMVVFSMRSEVHPQTPVDLFVSEPFDFDTEYDRALVGEIAPGIEARFVCLRTLIAMKEAVGRPKDQEDVRQLKLLAEELDGGP